jgi:two-component system chemotaxis response regulator CheY
LAFNLLVVDDSAVMRKMIIRSLRICGLPLGQVHEADNGEQGLKVLEQHWVDLALVDLNMPVLDGEEMIRRVRQQPALADLPIVVVSTDGSATRAERLRGSVAGFVHKPFTPEALRDTICDVLGVRVEQAGDDSLSRGGSDF